jgi:hypothetical protein
MESKCLYRTVASGMVMPNGATDADLDAAQAC